MITKHPCPVIAKRATTVVSDTSLAAADTCTLRTVQEGSFDEWWDATMGGRMQQSKYLARKAWDASRNWKPGVKE